MLLQCHMIGFYTIRSLFATEFILSLPSFLFRFAIFDRHKFYSINFHINGFDACFAQWVRNHFQKFPLFTIKYVYF